MDNDFENVIAQNIKKVREDRKLSQEDFANSLNLKRNSITLIENGKRNASDRTIKDICKTYNISEDWLRFGKGDMREIHPENDEYAEALKEIFNEKNDFRKKLYISLSKLDDTSWEVFEKFLKEINKE